MKSLMTGLLKGGFLRFTHKFALLACAARSFVAFGASLVFLTGCGTTARITPVAVSHSAIGSVENRKSGTILVKTFALARKQDPKFGRAIGSVPSAAGPGLNWVFVSSDPLGVGVQTTEFFSEALNAAGYKTIIETPETAADAKTASAILQGQIREFWLYGGLGGVDGKISVALKLFSPDGNNVLWEKEFATVRQKGMAFASYQTFANESVKVLSAALDDLLNQAAKEFASEQFYENRKKP